MAHIDGVCECADEIRFKKMRALMKFLDCLHGLNCPYEHEQHSRKGNGAYYRKGSFCRNHKN